MCGGLRERGSEISEKLERKSRETSEIELIFLLRIAKRVKLRQNSVKTWTKIRPEHKRKEFVWHEKPLESLIKSKSLKTN